MANCNIRMSLKITVEKNNPTNIFFLRTQVNQRKTKYYDVYKLFTILLNGHDSATLITLLHLRLIW